MIAGLFVFCGRQYAELCSARGLEVEARRATGCVDDMVEAVKKYGWDGEWYLRAYDFYGNKIGSHENEEGKKGEDRDPSKAVVFLGMRHRF